MELEYLLIGFALAVILLGGWLLSSVRRRFIFNRVCMGDSFAMARYRWHLLCMERATQRVLGRGMGSYRVVIGDQVIYPNDKD